MDKKPQTYWQPQSDAGAPAPKSQEDSGSQYSGYDLTASGDGKQPQGAPEGQTSEALISWEASEYVHHHKNPLWFVGLATVAALFFGVSVFLQAWTFAALVVVMTVAIVYFAVRPPRSLRYKLSASGLQINEHFYGYKEFRSFGVIQDGGLFSIMLLPVKRFMPALTVYFAQEDGEKIVDILGARLPMEQLKQDPIDRLMRNLRF